MALITPRTLAGFMELDPKSQLVFDKIKNKMEQVFQSYGFYAIDTPVLEHTEILLAKGGGETEKQVYRFLKGDTDITMRYDLTVPLAKYVAMNHPQLVFPFKRYQIGKVYRGEKSQRGRFREFYQCDIDIIGAGQLSVLNEAEVPSIMCQVFNEIGLHEFVIRMNNRKILNGLFEMKGIAEKKTEVLRTIDKLEKVGFDVVVEILEEQGIEKSVATSILELLSFQGSNEEILEKLSAMKDENALFAQGVEELSSVIHAMKYFGAKEENYKIDLTIARGLDYYTGTVYETTFLPKPEIGSICSGGRYDELASHYTKESLPGVGMSIGLTRLFYILKEYGYLNEENQNVVDVLVLPMTEDVSKAMEVATAIRQGGIQTQLYLENKKFKQKMTYANKLAVPYVVILGEDEIAENKLTLKDMRSGEQATITLEEAVEKIRQEVAQRNTSLIRVD